MKQDIEFRQLCPALGVEVLGVDLRADLADPAKERLREAWRKHALLLFRDQSLTEAQIERAASIFGEVTHEGDYPKYVSNVVEDALVPTGELHFHMDMSFKKDPLRGILLYGYEVPPEGAGGETLFANVQLAYTLLPPALRRRIEDLKIVHTVEYISRRGDKESSTHPIAFPHPVTGEIVLFCSPRHFKEMVGLDRSEGQALCDELASYISRPEVIYKHVWRAGDLAVWDNLKLQHARTDFDPKYRRHMHRTQIAALQPVHV